MADDTHGLGWVESPPDERDWTVDALYAATGVDAPDALPASYHVPTPLYPVLDQGSTPMCVAYSAAGEQGWYDLRDTGPVTFDEPTFFEWIHGTSNGAVIRDALAERLSTGYPPVSRPTDAGRHRIAAYYSVPVARQDVCAAILSFGPVVIGTPWYQSWFTPNAHGVLPPADKPVGGHAIQAVGWDATGLRLRNSWGPDWAQGGEATLPWGELGHVREAWKAVDQIVAPPRPRRYTLHVAAGARVVHYALDAAGRLTDRQVHPWGPGPSTAACGAPTVKQGAVRGQATVVLVPRGAFTRRWVKLGAGVTVSYT